MTDKNTSPEKDLFNNLAWEALAKQQNQATFIDTQFIRDQYVLRPKELIRLSLGQWFRCANALSKYENAGMALELAVTNSEACRIIASGELNTQATLNACIEYNNAWRNKGEKK